jgi:hypothetical protein
MTYLIKKIGRLSLLALLVLTGCQEETTTVVNDDGLYTVPNDSFRAASIVKPADRTYSSSLSAKTQDLYLAFVGQVSSDMLTGKGNQNALVSFPDLFARLTSISYLGGPDSQAKLVSYLKADNFTEIATAAKEITLALGTKNSALEGGSSYLAYDVCPENVSSVSKIRENLDSSTLAFLQGTVFEALAETDIGGYPAVAKMQPQDAVGENTVPEEAYEAMKFPILTMDYYSLFAALPLTATTSTFAGQSHAFCYSDKALLRSGKDYQRVELDSQTVTASFLLPDTVASGFEDPQEATESVGQESSVLLPSFTLPVRNDISDQLDRVSSKRLSLVSQNFVTGLSYQSETLTFNDQGFGKSSTAAPVSTDSKALTFNHGFSLAVSLKAEIAGQPVSLPVLKAWVTAL